MSSLKNALPQRIHQERHQPKARQRLGLLEHKRDYKLRAKDYRKKQKKLKDLYLATLTKNPDEFDFGMISDKVEKGQIKRTADSKKPLSDAEMKLLKKHDLVHVRRLICLEEKKLKHLERELLIRKDHKPVHFEYLSSSDDDSGNETPNENDYSNVDTSLNNSSSSTNRPKIKIINKQLQPPSLTGPYDGSSLYLQRQAVDLCEKRLEFLRHWEVQLEKIKPIPQSRQR